MHHTLKLFLSTLVVLCFALSLAMETAYAGSKKNKSRYCGSGYVWSKNFESCVPDLKIGIDQGSYLDKIKKKNKHK